MEALVLIVGFFNSAKRQVNASRQLKRQVSEATMLLCEIENMMSLLFDAANTTVVFTHVLQTNLRDFERIEAELAHVRFQLAYNGRLQRFIEAPTSTEQLSSIVCRLLKLKHHVELCAIIAELNGHKYLRKSC